MREILEETMKIKTVKIVTVIIVVSVALSACRGKFAGEELF